MKLRCYPGPEVTGFALRDSRIKIAADTIALLRKVDVFRVIDSVRPDNIDGVSRSSLANWIKAKRPDLGTEVDEVMAELA